MIEAWLYDYSVDGEHIGREGPVLLSGVPRVGDFVGGVLVVRVAFHAAQEGSATWRESKRLGRFDGPGLTIIVDPNTVGPFIP